MFFHQNPNPYLVASTLTFLAPLAVATRIHNMETQYALIFLLCASTSYHATKYRPLYYVDQVAVNYLVLRSVLDGYAGGASSFAISVSVNLICFYLYMYGRATQSLVWSPSFKVATAAHVFMHCLVATGYTCMLQLAEGADSKPIYDIAGELGSAQRLIVVNHGAKEKHFIDS